MSRPTTHTNSAETTVVEQSGGAQLQRGEPAGRRLVWKLGRRLAAARSGTTSMRGRSRRRARNPADLGLFAESAGFIMSVGCSSDRFVLTFTPVLRFRSPDSSNADLTAPRIDQISSFLLLRTNSTQGHAMLTHSFVDSAWLFPVHMSAAWQVQLERELERTQNEHVVRPQPPRPSITHACARGGRDGDRAAVTVSAAFSFDTPPPRPAPRAQLEHTRCARNHAHRLLVCFV